MPEIYLADHYGNDTDQNTAVSASRMKKILISCGACEGKDRGTIAAVHRLYREGRSRGEIQDILGLSAAMYGISKRFTD